MEPASVAWAGASYEEREEAGEAGYLELKVCSIFLVLTQMKYVKI